MHPPLAFGPADVGGGEIVVIGIIALLLFGKNLPAQARNLGRAIAAFKQTINQASSELHREMDAAAEGVEEAANEIKDEVKKDDPTAGLAEAVSGDTATSGTAGQTSSGIPAGGPGSDSFASPSAESQASSVPAPASSAPPAPAVSEAAALDALPRNIPPPTKIPPPVM
ncbi:MAG: twin-arginine translocase TatA/TatE family subunit [Planctomycetota bacterium]|nr:twin-arginine translocase TatA/TatE family subunit [Planctomycetota bacterium]